MFCWGKVSDGQLGLGGIEDPNVPIPLRNKFMEQKDVREVASGLLHAVLLLADGSLYSMGSNVAGALGRDTGSEKRPESVVAMDTHQVRHISCGHSHTMALTERGQLYSWGDDRHGQLGLGPTNLEPVRMPKQIKSLSKHVVVQIACGGHHNIALLQDGKVFSWGQNTFGQLGHGTTEYSKPHPQQIAVLDGLPIVSVHAGGYHSFVLTRSSTMYGWGRNNFGQLGIGNTMDQLSPMLLRSLNSLNSKVKYIACGDEHTVVLTEDGGVFSFGSGGCGQLGHNSTQAEMMPRKVFEFMGSTVSQIACGRNHTLALVKSTGRIYGCGLGGSGQLGTGFLTNHKIPTPVLGNWCPLYTPAQGVPVDHNLFLVKKIFAGGDQSFATFSMPYDPTFVADYREIPEEDTPFYFSLSSIQEGNKEALLKKLEVVFSSASCVNSCFLSSNHCNTSPEDCGIDFNHVKLASTILKSSSHFNDYQKKINYCLQSRLLPTLPPDPLDLECIRLYISLPLFFLLYSQDLNNYKLLLPFSIAFLNLSSGAKTLIGTWMIKLPAEDFAYIQSLFRDCITCILPELYKPSTSYEQLSVVPQDYVSMVDNSLKVLKYFDEWNINANYVISITEFYIPVINDLVDLKQDYIMWIKKKAGLVYCSYPFVLNSQAKASLLQVDANYQMMYIFDETYRRNLTSLFSGGTAGLDNPYLDLRIRRCNLIEDTLNQLANRHDYHLKKPLRIAFHGEEGLDAGGVQKEFFLLLLREILNPDYGMFVEDNESHMLWFSECSFEHEQMYNLIGTLCGLGIYNAVIIDLPFPLALYKKILEQSPSLDDLCQLKPSLGNSFRTLLEYEGDDFEEHYTLHFEITRNQFGEVVTKELIPGGSQINVTKENRREFVEAYIGYLFNQSVYPAFQAFSHGFLKVCGGQVLQLFRAEELQSLVVGNELHDFREMETVTQYKGYGQNDRTIKIFWVICHALPKDAKKRLLAFWTGCDKIPITGIRSMKMTIQKMDGGKRNEKLPVAHTCFNILELPPYHCEDLMKGKLLQAIHFTEGFGLV